MCVQALVEYCRGVGLPLDQAGYQALASACVKEEDAMTLLDMMKVSRDTRCSHDDIPTMRVT